MHGVFVVLTHELWDMRSRNTLHFVTCKSEKCYVSSCNAFLAGGSNKKDHTWEGGREWRLYCD